MNGPSQIAQNYVNVGVGKTRYGLIKTLALGIMAGAFISFGALGSTIGSVGLQPAGLSRIVSSLVFPIGLVLVLCAGGELFTGNSLVLIPVLERRIKPMDMFRNWGLAYTGNLVGSILIAELVVLSGTLDLYPGLSAAAINTAMAKCRLPIHAALIKGICSNFMVCLAVWISFGASEMAGKIAATYLPVFLFVLRGFEHRVANMYFIPVGLFASYVYPDVADALGSIGLNWFNFIFRNLIPVTIGNLVGGAACVAGVYWAAYLKKR
ncbi:MAG: formate/nitrite transporter family protein [Treponema sp.]|nr:formate/nitrite transporter family protein [Treponema sp.]